MRKGWQRGLEAALNGMLLFGDVLLVLVQNIIVAFGTLVILALLLVVEVHAVSLGILRFELSAAYATMGAVLLVLVSLSAKFQEVYADYNASDLRTRYQMPKQVAPSLRLMVGGWLYWLGIGRNWTPRELSAGHAFAVMRKTITGGILIIAFIGRTGEAITRISTDTSGAPIGWQEGIDLLIHSSSLSDMAQWIAALVFTYVAVRSSQQLTGYVAVRVLEIRRTFAVRRPSAPDDQRTDSGQVERTVVRRPLSVRSGQRTDSGHGTGNGYSKRMDARAVVWEHLQAHPESAELSVRDLVPRLGVGRTTINEVMREWRAAQQPAVYTNGHEQHE